MTNHTPALSLDPLQEDQDPTAPASNVLTFLTPFKKRCLSPSGVSSRQFPQPGAAPRRSRTEKLAALSIVSPEAAAAVDDLIDAYLWKYEKHGSHE